ncbi:MAG: glyoxylate/hydroxypyruvate reductase A [Wenzhouxiangellaceae bacterium]|nr:glyoxylate/hydroxypyruvate reductase A [Wenzhouxiangellaceae bacterium]
MSDALLICLPDRDGPGFAQRVREHLPKADVRVWPELGDADQIAFAVTWNPPRGLFARLTGLQAVTSMGAGVDALLADPELPRHIALGRLAGPRLAADMAGFLVASILSHWRQLDQFRDNQRLERWQPWAPERSPIIGVLGTGVLGQAAARAFAALAIEVHGCNRSGRSVPGFDSIVPHKRLSELAGAVDVLINLLPLTPDTTGILNRRLFATMRPDATLVNVGRGAHLVEDDLLAALATGRPAHAILDVFRDEPLPPGHPFWQHPKIRITPHCAAITHPDEAASLAAESYRRVLGGEPPLGRVERQRGY